VPNIFSTKKREEKNIRAAGFGVARRTGKRGRGEGGSGGAHPAFLIYSPVVDAPLKKKEGWLPEDKALADEKQQD